MISIAIVTLNNPEYLDLALKSIDQNTKGPYEVLVHANAVTSKDLEIITKWQLKQVVAIFTESNDNLYCAEPLNNLFNFYAQGDYFIFLDDDIYVAPGWDEELTNSIDSNIKYFWLSPTLYYPKCAHQPSRYNVKSFGLHPNSFLEKEFNSTWVQNRNITKDNKGWISGAGLISRETWKKIGGYDEKFKIGEDVDIKAKIWQKAVSENKLYDFRSIADSVVYHFGHSGSVKRPQIMDPFKMFKEKWQMSIGEFYKKALPEIDYL